VKEKKNIKIDALNKKLKYSLNISREYFVFLQLKNEIIIYNILQVEAVTIKVIKFYANKIKKSYKTNANAKKILQKLE